MMTMHTLPYKDHEVDLTYSEDEGIWYFTLWPEQVTSVSYQTRREAHTAYKENAIEWETQPEKEAA